MNSWIGSKEMGTLEERTPFRIFVKDSDLAAGRPSAVCVILDEHTLTLDDGWFEVTMDDSQPFASFPAIRHQNGYGLNFADGHAEIYRLRTAAAQIAETQAQAFTQSAFKQLPATNADWIKLKGVTTSP
jgi:prepilin-type processing-associated H-X9-DG protein